MPSSKQHKPMSRRNFWTPLQLNDDDDEDDNDDNGGATAKKKISISPIKVLTDNRENILKLLQGKGITNYLNKKMSIGLKIICGSIDSYNSILNILKEGNIQFFTHDRKDEKPFKAIIHGLDGKSESEVKTELLRLGYKCTEVKKIIKTSNNYVDTLYIVYFERGTVRMHDLRKNTKALFYTIIRWDFQKKIKNKPVQCRKCQMYGHGERGCNIKPKCATCAGKHRTADCQSPAVIRCANCKNNHKATDPICPNRASFIEMRERFVNNNTLPNRRNVSTPVYNNNATNFPSVSKYSRVNGNTHHNFSWNHHTNNNNNTNINNTNNNKQNSTPNNSPNDLFTQEEVMQLTFEMVSSLRPCKSRDDQFNVIASLAIKFLYGNK